MFNKRLERSAPCWRNIHQLQHLGEVGVERVLFLLKNRSPQSVWSALLGGLMDPEVQTLHTSANAVLTHMSVLLLSKDGASSLTGKTSRETSRETTESPPQLMTRPSRL